MTGGNAILQAAPLLEALMKQEAAEKLEVSADDLELHQGTVWCRSHLAQSPSGAGGFFLRGGEPPARDADPQTYAFLTSQRVISAPLGLPKIA